MNIKFLLILLLCTVNLDAQDYKISLNKLTEETQILSESPDNLKLVWWIPVEFWQAVFADEQAMPKEQANEILEVFKQYTMLATLDGEIGNYGNISYKSQVEIFNSISLIDHNKNSFLPLKNSEIDDKTKEVLSFIKPVLSNMLGQMGANMHFFLFENKLNPGQRIIDPISKESFAVNLADEIFTYKLPLGSLLRPKKCPVDNEMLNGAWQFCPYHGKALVPK